MDSLVLDCLPKFFKNLLRNNKDRQNSQREVWSGRPKVQRWRPEICMALHRHLAQQLFHHVWTSDILRFIPNCQNVIQTDLMSGKYKENYCPDHFPSLVRRYWGISGQFKYPNSSVATFCPQALGTVEA